MVTLHLLLVLQGAEPEQSAAAAADAAAGAAAQHLPHAALTPEREGHDPPRRVTHRHGGDWTGECV